ncbi:MAG: DUF4298 domain-containing protein [bacterium]|nr:DUF4298 domain-containing protein [bacterium]
MPLPETDLKKLLAMQDLCDRIIDQTKALAATQKAIRSLNKDLRKLESLYEKDWLSIVSDKRISGKDEAALAAAVKKGRYSVLGQDTIWNALQEAYQVQVALTKVLVKNLKV